MYFGQDINEELYNGLIDEDIVDRVKDGDKHAQEYLINKYKSLVNMKSFKYYMNGADKEDMVQEGLIGLYKATMSFEKGKNSSFKSFADLCIKRQVYTAMTKSNRKKHQHLNGSVSLNNTLSDDESDDSSMFEIIQNTDVQDPLETITQREYMERIENIIEEVLSDFEKQVLIHFINGDSYVDIAKKLDTPVKSIDNAIQRIRKKSIRGLANQDEQF